MSELYSSSISLGTGLHDYSGKTNVALNYLWQYGFIRNDRQHRQPELHRSRRRSSRWNDSGPLRFPFTKGKKIPTLNSTLVKTSHLQSSCGFFVDSN